VENRRLKKSSKKFEENREPTKNAEGTMPLFDGLRRQLRSVIEWKDPGPNVLFQRWSDNGDEIKNASRLIVGPGQGCIFVYEGQVRSVLMRECLIRLETDNVPFWTTVKKFMQFFQSEHKVGLYFFRRTKILDQKWGTTSLIKYEDPKYRFPVGLCAYGNTSFRITDPESFFVHVVGGSSSYLIDDFRRVMNTRLIQPLTDHLAEARYSYADIDAQRQEIAARIGQKLVPEFEKLGFEITDFRIEGTGFDEDTMERINRIAHVTAEAAAASAAGLNYTQMQQLEAMREAARNEGGAAGIGLGVGAGMGFGQRMSELMGNAAGPTGSGNEKPQEGDPVQSLRRLKEMVEGELITADEYILKKKEILSRM
jgi:membrane protease subunit (stomatin/prohibitin family)